jgi:phenylacetate-CoA ligase
MTKNLIDKMYRDVVNLTRGLTGAYLAYPIAERFEKRHIRSKVKELKQYYNLPLAERKKIMLEQLISTLQFAGNRVPYYKELFATINFNPELLRKDVAYLQELPYLTKEIIREQGQRLLSQPLHEVRHHVRKTGGSTGPSAVIYYDQEGLDYSAAVTLYCRERIGALHHKPEIHFAASFAKPEKNRLPRKEDIKNIALNRNNVFFDRLDPAGLEEIIKSLEKYRPYLVHAHPSTLYALALYVEQKYGSTKLFNVFESSGELLTPLMRSKIESVFSVPVIDRYGLAEFGVIGYELEGHERGIQILDSEGWAEDNETSEGYEYVFTGFRNKLMPLIRYVTGDMAKVEIKNNSMVMSCVYGRVHDMVRINGTLYPTHNIMDVMDHVIGGVQEFQIDTRSNPQTLRLLIEPGADASVIKNKIDVYWQNAFDVKFVSHEEFIRVGQLSKFRHAIQKSTQYPNKRLLIDISSFIGFSGNLTGISRLMVNFIYQIRMNHPEYSVYGISFRDTEKYEIYQLDPNIQVQFSKGSYPDLELTIEDNDTILLFGEQWLFAACQKHLENIKLCKRVTIINLIYDLVPFFMPELYWDGFPQQYMKTISNSIRISDRIVVISENTKKDLLRFFPMLDSKKICTVRLGDDFGSTVDRFNHDTIKNAIRIPEEYVLCVSTIQPRKNHLLLLTVWRRLLSERKQSCPKLVIVGQIGWNVENFIYYVQNNPELKENIVILDNVDDYNLMQLYSNGLFTVYPSLYEGWGLPIGESLAFGKLCLVSETSSMPEIAGNIVEYFSPYDSGRLYELICKYFDDRGALRMKETLIRKEYNSILWTQTASELLHKIIMSGNDNE